MMKLLKLLLNNKGKPEYDQLQQRKRHKSWFYVQDRSQHEEVLRVALMNMDWFSVKFKSLNIAQRVMPSKNCFG